MEKANDEIVQKIVLVPTENNETEQLSTQLNENKTAELNEINQNKESVDIVEDKIDSSDNPSEIITIQQGTNTKDTQPVNDSGDIVPDAVHNSSLSLLAQYASDDDSEYESDTDDKSEHEIGNKPDGTVASTTQSTDEQTLVLQKIQEHISSGPYRVASSSSEYESSSSDSSDVEEIPLKAELDEFLDEDAANTPKGPIKSVGELGIDDLPPIEDLKITVAEEECVELGRIMSIVEQLVLVDSIPGTVPLNLDTVLFLDRGKKALGQIFDVLGNVSSPIYCVRFNSNDEIKQKQIEIGTMVYVAPRTEHTSFVILSELMKDKGTDASRENDNENSSNSEYSDDETERRAHTSKLGKIKQNTATNSMDNTKRQRHTNRGNGRGSNQMYRGGYRQPRHFHTNYNHSWHSNYQQNQGNHSTGPFYPNPYARPIGPQMNQSVFSVPTSFLQAPPPPPPPPSSSSGPYQA